MRNKVFIKIALILQLFLTIDLSAGVITRSTRLLGGQIAVNATSETHDELYGYMLTTSPSLWNFTDTRVDNRIKLRFMAADKKYYTQAWSIGVDFKVDLYNNQGLFISTQNSNVSIDYDPTGGAIYTDVATYTTTGGYSAQITVTNITMSSNLGGVMPTDVMLENEVETERYYTLDVTANPLLQATYNSSDNTILFTWGFVEGAEEFDLEWLYVYDNVYALGSGAYTFDNATRITTPQGFYSIDAAFDKGVLLYRIRTVGRHGAGFALRKEGFWHQPNTTITLSDFQNNKRNWTYSAVYAEEGKRKEIATFFDGSTRNRQSVTVNNSDNIALVMESFYDYEGRSSVKTLPAPNINSTVYDHQLKYYSNYSKNQNSVLYSKLDYDNSANSCAGVGKMKNLFGSSMYFSTNNSIAIGNGFNSFIPDAQEYPFVHTRYGLQGVSTSVSGTGLALKTGSGHETKMYDVGAGQEKLDRIFGNEAGYASHYREKLTIDPNNQVSVSYVNMAGKVVATALRGHNPNPNLTPLIADDPMNPLDQNEPYMNDELTKEDFSAFNQFKGSSQCNEITKNFAVTNALGTSYIFTYSISPQTFNEICLGNTYPCKYNLTITIKDECGNLVNDVGNYLNVNHPITSTFPGQTITVNFPQNGVYTIVKTLCLDQTQAAADYAQYLADIANPAIPNSCIDFNAIKSEYENQIDQEECLTCEQYAAQIADGQATPNTPAWNTAYQNALRDNCFEPPKKGCGPLHDNILNDVSPGGQYFEKTPPTLSSKWVDELYNANASSGTLNGNWFNSIAPTTCPPIPPFVPSLYAYLTANWDPCYAQKLEAFHPEECRYSRCLDLACSESYEFYLENLDYNMATTTDGNQQLCTNPVGCAILDVLTTPVGISVMNNDPFFSTSPPSGCASHAALAPTMSLEINQCPTCVTMYNASLFTNSPNNFPTSCVLSSGNHTMWEYAQYIPNLAGTCSGGSFTPDPVQQWKNFLTLYLSVKAKLVAAIPCHQLQDNSNPPDNVTDSYPNILNIPNGGIIIAGGVIIMDGMQILDPDPVNYVSTHAGNVNTNGYSNGGTQSSVNCYTAVFAKFNYQAICNFNLLCGGNEYEDNVVISVANVPNQTNNPLFLTYGGTGVGNSPLHAVPINIANPTINPYSICSGSPLCTGAHPDPNCSNNYYSGNPCNISFCDRYIALQQIAQNINNNTSLTGFTAVVGPTPVLGSSSCTMMTDPEITIYADPNVLPYLTPAVQSNPSTAMTMLVGTNQNYDDLGFRNFTFNSSQRTCPEEHCLCSEFDILKGQFFAANPTIETADPNLINPTNVTTFVNYALPLLNNNYNPSPAFTSAQVTYWYNNCNLYGNVYPLDASGDVALPSQGSGLTLHNVTCDEACQGQQEAVDEADFEADQAINNLVNQSAQNFLNDYTSACFKNLNEIFNVQYNESEYHYTLYYYDQAGNLTRTVPPKAVKRIDAATLYNVTSGIDIVDNARLANIGFIYPGHSLNPQAIGLNANYFVSNYSYNTLNQVTAQVTPDGSTGSGNLTQFWYDLLSRLRFSQNSKQIANAIIVPGSSYYGNYSYTIYDNLNRVIEVGENDQIGSACLPDITPPPNGNPNSERYFSPGNIQGGSTSGASCPGGYVLTNVPFFWMVNNQNFPTQPGHQVTKTYYDQVITSNNAHTVFPGGIQLNLRKRIATNSYEEMEDSDDNTYDHASHYSYDVHGNIQELVQENTLLNRIGQQYKIAHYDYDLISGKTKMVSYQKGQLDQFFHHFYYDADSRLTNSFSSKDFVHWDQDSRHFFYPHGPEARVELADEKVQGMDYVNTIQGWLKGVNNNNLNARKDVGLDAVTGTHLFPRQYSPDPNEADIHQNVGSDATGYLLDYFNGDYSSVFLGLYNGFSGNIQNSTFISSVPELFNGNIKGMSYGISFPSTASTFQNAARVFKYDQLNRLTYSETYSNATSSDYSLVSFHSSHSTSDYYEDFRYDPNGNIMEANRKATNNGGNNNLDHLVYHYTSPYNNNMLDYVEDQQDGNYTTDIKAGQTIGNYQYDQIGNLVGDVTEEIFNIDWNVYKKIKSITRLPNSNKSDLEFRYDSYGRRVCKIVKPRIGGNPSNQDSWTYTFYIRDLEGNVMAVMNRKFSSSTVNHYNEQVILKELDVYGTSRLAISNQDIGLASANFTNIPFTNNQFSDIKSYVVGAMPPLTNNLTRMLGNKSFELTNHLGNVLAVVSDRKIPNSSSTIVDHYTADIQSATDYYAFGMPMMGREVNPYSGSSGYRYGFNGKENDPEDVSTDGGNQDYGMRIYNPALGRFLSVDPLAHNFASNTVYSYAENSPILNIDMDGLEKIKFGATVVDFTQFKTKDAIQKELDKYYAYHQDNLDASDIMETNKDDNEIWTVKNYSNEFCKSTGTRIRKYASAASYKTGNGFPYSNELVRDISQWLYAKDSQFDGEKGMVPGLLFGASAVGTIFSGGSLGLAISGGRAAGVAFWFSVASFAGSVDGLTAGPKGQTLLESLANKLGGENGETVFKFVKLSVSIIDVNNSTRQIVGELQNGTKFTGQWDVLNNVFAYFDIVKTEVEMSKPDEKKKATKQTGNPGDK